MAGRLAGRRVLVVGSSVGIGKVVGQTLVAEGAAVAFASRRKELCETAAREAMAAHGGTAIGVACDVTDEAQCQSAIDATVSALGGLDDVVYSTGLISLVALQDADASWWQRTLATNVVGAALITRFALPHLQRSTGTVAYLSSVSSVGAPWPGIGVYTASKAALNRMIETWRSEHPEVGFTRILVGPTGDAATGSEYHESAFPHMARHAALGICSGALSPPSAVASAVVLALSEESRLWDITVQPKDPALPWGATPGIVV